MKGCWRTMSIHVAVAITGSFRASIIGEPRKVVYPTV